MADDNFDDEEGNEEGSSGVMAMVLPFATATAEIVLLLDRLTTRNAWP